MVGECQGWGKSIASCADGQRRCRKHFMARNTAPGV